MIVLLIRESYGTAAEKTRNRQPDEFFDRKRDIDMGLNKKQKKQIDAARKKIQKNQQLVAAARDQPDDPNEIDRLRQEIADLEAEIEKIKQQ